MPGSQRAHFVADVVLADAGQVIQPAPGDAEAEGDGRRHGDGQERGQGVVDDAEGLRRFVPGPVGGRHRRRGGEGAGRAKGVAVEQGGLRRSVQVVALAQIDGQEAR